MPSFGGTTKYFNSKASSFVKYHVNGRKPYDIFNRGAELSIDSVESTIREALGMKKTYKGTVEANNSLI